MQRLGESSSNSNGYLFGHFKNIALPKTLCVLEYNALNLPSENIDLSNVKIMTHGALLEPLDKIKKNLDLL